MSSQPLDKAAKGKSKKADSKKKKSSRKLDESSKSRFCNSVYTAIPVQISTEWKRATSSVTTAPVLNISSARVTALKSSKQEKEEPLVSNPPLVSIHHENSGPSPTADVYSAVSSASTQFSPSSTANTLEISHGRQGRGKSMMYGVFAAQDDLGVATEPVRSSPKPVVPTSLSLPHLMGRRMVAQPNNALYSASISGDHPVNPSFPSLYSPIENESKSCVTSGACMPSLYEPIPTSTIADMARAVPESLGQRTAREYASHTSYSSFFKSEEEMHQQSLGNTTVSKTPAVCTPVVEAPLADVVTEPQTRALSTNNDGYDSSVYWTIAPQEETDSEGVDKRAGSESESQKAIGYSHPDDLILHIDEQLRECSDFSKNGVKKAPNIAEQDHIYNKQFQQILEDTSLTKFVSLASLGSNFVTLAETYARIIVSERCLPLDQKSIKPVDVGGAAGGEKFLVSGIIFKYAVDTVIGEYPDGSSRWMYGGPVSNDFFAMKAACNELLGLSHFMQYQVPGLSFPLMALIDYCGYRLVAISTLPINKKTIVYGSADAGRHIYNSDPKVAEAMRQVGKHMNLREHLVFDTPIVSAGDIEVHKGLDGRNYVIDFARAFPPEAPRPGDPPQSIFFRLLRPELVSQYPVPLSSDAFSGWQAYDPMSDQMNRDVVDATNHLHEGIIADYPKKWLNREFQEYFRAEFCNICDLHRNGINLRHLGKVRAAMIKHTDENDALYLGDMIARSIKNRLRQTQRAITDRMKVFAEEPHKLEFLKALNLLTAPKSHQSFWTTEIKEMILSYFGPDALHPHEKEPEYSLIDSVPGFMRHFLVWRVCFLQGITLPQHLIQDAQKCFAAGMEFEFFSEDIAEPSIFRPRIKYMALVDFSAALAGYMRAMSQIDQPLRALSTHRLLNEAKSRMLRATDRITNMAPGLLWISKIYFLSSVFDSSCEEQRANLGRVVGLLRVYRKMSPDDTSACVLLASAALLYLIIGGEKERKFDSQYMEVAVDALAASADKENEVETEILSWFGRSDKLRPHKYSSAETHDFLARAHSVLPKLLIDSSVENIAKAIERLQTA